MEGADINTQRATIRARQQAVLDDSAAYAALQDQLKALDTEESRLVDKEQRAAEARAKADRAARVVSKRQTITRAAAQFNAICARSLEFDAWVATGGSLYTEMLANYAGLRSCLEDAIGRPLDGADQAMMIEHSVRLRLKQAGLPIPKTEPDPRARLVASVVRDSANASVQEFKRTARGDAVLSEALQEIDL